MRDDLHKGTSLPTHWRRVIRRACRDSDWASGVPEAMETAALRELRRILADPDIRGALVEANAAQGSLLGPDALLPQRAGNELYRSLRSHCCLLHAEGRPWAEHFGDALAAVLGERIDANKREVLAHTVRRSARDVPEMNRRLSEAGQKVDPAKLVAKHFAGKVVRTRISLDLDGDDLLGGFK